MNIVRWSVKIFQNNVQNYGMCFNRALTYKSAISLNSLHPNSSLKLTTLPEPPVAENFSGYIPIDQLQIVYSRSAGPGGQNVNKINTKVDLRFHLQSASWLDEKVKAKLAENLQTKITKDGYVVFRSELTRSQQLNLADCLQKLRVAIRNTYTEHKVAEDTLEKLRRRYEKSIRERLSLKRERSRVKSDRQTPSIHE